ncbi:MAG: hypothetical protein H8D43_01085 [Chloroflexi bacterium]|nr:hypothetical protein [Chloroflexota bacterium]
MRVKIAIACIFIGLTLTASACNVLPDVVPGTATPEPGRWRIIPTEMEVKPTGGGWHSVRIEVAYENGTQEFSTKQFAMDGSYIVVEEGFTYPVWARDAGLGPGWGNSPFIGVEDYGVLPPGFRARGIREVIGGWGVGQGVNEHYRCLHAQIAQDTHPSRIVIPAYGEIDLEQDIRNVVFPREALSMPEREAGDAVEVPGRAMLTVERFTREKLDVSESFGELDWVTAYLRFENLNAGYAEGLTVHFGLIGADGFFHTAYQLQDCDSWPTLSAGPAQTTETKVCYAVRPTTKNLKLILTGDVNAVYDTGF